MSGLPCIAPGCTAPRLRSSKHRYCNLHSYRVRLYAHPEGRAVRIKDLRQHERRILASLRAVTPQFRLRVEENATATVAVFREHVKEVIASTIAPRGTASTRLRPGERTKAQHGAATALKAVLEHCDPMTIVVRTAAILLFHREQPAVMRDQGAYLFHYVRRLHRMADRGYYDSRRAGTRHGGYRTAYRLPTQLEREIGSGWIVEALVPAASVLLRIVKAAEEVPRVERQLARDLGAQGEEEIAAWIARLRRAARTQAAYQRQQAQKREAQTPQAQP